MRPYIWNPWATAGEQPGRPAVVVDGKTCTFGELVCRADDLGRGLRAMGVADGSVISTDIPTGPRFFALALATLRYGYGLFPVNRELFASSVGASLLKTMDVAMHVTGWRQAADGAALPCSAHVDDDLAVMAAHHHTGSTSAPPPRAGYLAFSTSGTTGGPQAVPRARPRRPYKGVAVAERYAAGLQLGPHVMANPTYHLGTLGPALYALQAGSAVVVQRTWSPAAFAELIDRHRADSAMLSPDRLLDVVEAGHGPRRQVRAVFHGGAACPPAVKRSAIELLGPVLHEYYGTSKSIITEITTQEWLRNCGSVGRPLPGIRIEMQEDGRTLPAGEVGEICVHLRAADLGPADDSVLHTGDIGFLNDDGYLFVVGRAGTSEPPAQARLEYEIRLLPGVTDVAVVSGTDPACYVETGRDRTADLAASINETANRLGFPAPRITLVPSGSLLRTPSGKIRRAALAAADG